MSGCWTKDLRRLSKFKTTLQWNEKFSIQARVSPLSSSRNQIRHRFQDPNFMQGKSSIMSRKNRCGINLLNITLSSPRPLATFWIDLKTSKFFTFSWKKYFLSEIKGNEYRFHLKSKNITLKFCNRRSLGIKKQLSSPRCTEHLCKFPADNCKFPARSEDHERRQHFFRDASSGKEILQAEPASQRS